MIKMVTKCPECGVEVIITVVVDQWSAKTLDGSPHSHDE